MNSWFSLHGAASCGHHILFATTHLEKKNPSSPFCHYFRGPRCFAANFLPCSSEIEVKLKVGGKSRAQRDHLQLQEKLKASFTTTGYHVFHTPSAPPLNLHPRRGFWPQWLKFGRRCSALRFETRWRWRWGKAGSCRRCWP